MTRELTSKDVKRLGLGHLLDDAKPVKHHKIKVDSEYGAIGLRRKLKASGRTIIIKNGVFVNDIENLYEPGEDSEGQNQENYNPEG